MCQFGDIELSDLVINSLEPVEQREQYSVDLLIQDGGQDDPQSIIHPVCAD
jgi:hypothetical protein